jgi:hypothetical protein
MPVRAILAILAVTLAFAAIACSGDGGDDDDATPTVVTEPTRDRTPVATPPPLETPSIDIRDIDLSTLPEVVESLSESGALIVQTDVIYVDITNDGIEDAVAPASIDGTLGHIGFFAFRPDGDGVRKLLEEFPESSGGVEISVEGEKIVMVQPVAGPDDPECCPSLLQRSIFSWNGTAMALETVTTEENPDGGGKKTSTPTP